MPKMNRAAVIKTVTKNYDQKIEAQRETLRRLEDPNYYADQVNDWRKECESLVTNLYNRLTDNETQVTDSELSRFKLPPRPNSDVEYKTGFARRRIKSLETGKDRALDYINARASEGDDITLSQSELKYVGFHQEVEQ